MTADSTPSPSAASPVPLTPYKPSIHGVYGDWRKGKDTFAPDREMADTITRSVPGMPDVIRQNWAFQVRAVEYLAKDAGIQQYIDIGPGIPVDGEPLLPDIARRYQPDCRWVAVDNHETVLVRWRQEFDRGDDRLQVMFGDLRDPAAILKNVRKHLDLSKPVALIAGAVWHFVTGPKRPIRIMRTLQEALAPGSYLAITNATDDGAQGDAKAAMRESAARYSKEVAPIVLRSRAEFRALLEGWTLLEPGVAKTVDWLVPEEGLVFEADAPHAWAALAVLAN